MARRGEVLRDHILQTAKFVFIEQGYERASMDVVAARAGTSKRSLYAHFESKDKLFRDVIGLVRELYLGRLGAPADYADDPAEAAALFCGRLLQLLLWESALRTARLGIAEAERLPEAAAGYYDAIFGEPSRRLAEHVALHWPSVDADEVTRLALGRAVFPALFQALLGVTPALPEQPDLAALAADVDLPPIRAALRALLGGS